MVEMRIFPKRNRVAGFQDIKIGRETIGGKIRFNKKPSKPQKHIQIKVILRFNQPINEVRPKFFNSKFPLTTTSSNKISLPMEQQSYEGVRRTKKTDSHYYREQSL